ncbi:MAG: ATPase/DNA packaging protein [Bacteroidota bacterium]
MKRLKVLPIKVPKGYKHPEPPNIALPRHEFTMGLIAPKGAGKTTVICNLLQFYSGYFHTILVFSPTIESDEKWDVIKDSKLLVENKPLKKFLKELKRKKSKNAVLDPPRETRVVEDDDPPFSPYIPEEHFYDDYDDVTFQSIMQEQKAMINLLKRNGAPKYLANRILIIFDDLVGSALFSGTRGSYFKGVNTRHRHYSSSFIMVSQGYKEIPKTIRTNFTCLIVFEIGNEKELEVIYEEFPMGLKKDDWMELYNYAIATDYAFLYINFQQEKRLRMMKNFEEYLFIGK